MITTPVTAASLEQLREELATTRAEAHRREAELVEQERVMTDNLRVIAASTP